MLMIGCRDIAATRGLSCDPLASCPVWSLLDTEAADRSRKAPIRASHYLYLSLYMYIHVHDVCREREREIEIYTKHKRLRARKGRRCPKTQIYPYRPHLITGVLRFEERCYVAKPSAIVLLTTCAAMTCKLDARVFASARSPLRDTLGRRQKGTP